MEIFELKYFLGVAKEENIHRASERLHVSPASLSKAIARLENELSVSLFSRDGRNIRLTDHGKLLQKRASEIIHLEEAARLELSGHEGTIQVVIAGPEILLSEIGMKISADIKRKFPKSRFEYHAVTDEEAIAQVSQGESHIALVTSDVPDHLELSTKIVAEPHFLTVVGERHPLFSVAQSKKTIPIEKVLEHSFVSPNHPLLGKVGLKQSVDGWRDDKFPRHVEFLTSSLKLLEELVTQGRALAYLPDYYAKRIGVEVLKISGCPYTCVQKIRLVAKNPKDRSWLNQIF
ncbi:MAG: LysR family transcriptional regulator [Bdellovibrio sp.]